MTLKKKILLLDLVSNGILWFFNLIIFIITIFDDDYFWRQYYSPFFFFYLVIYNFVFSSITYYFLLKDKILKARAIYLVTTLNLILFTVISFPSLFGLLFAIGYSGDKEYEYLFWIAFSLPFLFALWHLGITVWDYWITTKKEQTE